MKRWVLCIFSTLLLNCREQPKTVWENYVHAKKEGLTPILPDFSYAGYKYREEPIPDVDYKIFNVTNFFMTEIILEYLMGHVFSFIQKKNRAINNRFIARFVIE